MMTYPVKKIGLDHNIGHGVGWVEQSETQQLICVGFRSSTQPTGNSDDLKYDLCQKIRVLGQSGTRRLTLIVITFWVQWLMIAPMGLCSDQVSDLLASARRGGDFKAVSHQELKQSEVLFRQIFNGFSDDVAQKKTIQAWAGIGFEMRKTLCGGKPCFVVHETTGRKEGRGFFILSNSGNSFPILLQIPHSFKDLFTGKIGLLFVLENAYRAAAWNTLPRSYKRNKQSIHCDFSDLFNTHFASMAKAFILSRPQGFVVQLHGYAQHKRKSRDGKASDIIISSGSINPDPWLKQMDHCLEQKFDWSVKRFPEEVRELGATQTSIGILMRGLGSKKFAHIEMSKPVRLKLRDNLDYRQKINQCIKELLL